MLRDEKILITGPGGRIAFGIASSLVSDNEVWGAARFSEPGSREMVESLGVTTRVVDIANLPADTPVVTPEERKEPLRIRCEGAQLRRIW